MSTRPTTTSHRARSRPRHPRRSRRARAACGPCRCCGKRPRYHAIPSASTDAVQKARFPQHLGRRRRRPQARQATLSLLSTTTSRVGSSKIRCDNHGRELTEQRRYAPMMGWTPPPDRVGHRRDGDGRLGGAARHEGLGLDPRISIHPHTSIPLRRNPCSRSPELRSPA